MSCLCNEGMSNIGVRPCDVLFNETVMIYAVPTIANDGTRNKVAAADTLDEAYFLAKINNADPSKRWYPIIGIENVKDVRANDEVHTTDSGNKIRIQDGVRSFEGKLYNWSARMVGKLNSIGCNSISIYRVDNQNTLIGKTDGTDFYPVKLQKNTVQTLFTWATSKTPQDITIMFDFDRIEKDEYLRGIRSSSMGNIDFTVLPALFDVTVAITAITATGFTATLKGDEDEFGKDFFIEGFTKDDFALTKAGVAVPLITATETSPGVYVCTNATATGTHELNKASTKTGYELPTSSVVFP